MNARIADALTLAVKSCPEAMEQIRLAVRENWEALDDVPEELRDAAMCRDALSQNGNALGFVPEKLRTPDVCAEAVKKDGMALVFVPPSRRTPEMCMSAVERDGLAFLYVPDDLKTVPMCLAALNEKGCLEDWEQAAAEYEFMNGGYDSVEDVSVDFWNGIPARIRDEVQAAYEAQQESPAP